jgi:uncharacterized protein (TIGR03663 family)
MQKKTILRISLFSAALAAGALLRLPGLSHRPMHADEAVHALQFGDLLDRGVFVYDPLEYHGPSLILFTAVPAWTMGEKSLDRTDETTFRIVPVFFGLMSILILVMLKRGMGTPWFLAAAFWTAVSTPLVFYSRYYIHESLLVFFTFSALVSGYRYLSSRAWYWALGFGFSMGLMHATKETCVIVWLTAAVAGALVYLHSFLIKKADSVHAGKIPLAHVLIAVVSAAVVSVLLFSSFFRNPEGVADSIHAFIFYLKRTSAASVHDHSWGYYFRLMLPRHDAGKPVWTEIPVMLLACVGGISAFRKRASGTVDYRLARFIVFYTVILFLVYSAIPYKTPWCALGFYHGLVLLAGLGTIVLWTSVKNNFQKTITGIFLIILCGVVVRQSILLNGRYDSDPGNPWVYAQTSPDVFQMIRAVDEAADAAPDRRRTHVDVVMTGHGYWPLPWYFRKLENVGWYDHIPDTGSVAAVVVIATELEAEWVRALYDKPRSVKWPFYIPLWKEPLCLRPGVEVEGYARTDIIQTGKLKY